MLAFIIPGAPGWAELLIVAGIFLLLFGANRLPSLMRNMGRSVNEFKAGLTDRPNKKDDATDDATDDAVGHAAEDSGAVATHRTEEKVS